MEFLHHGDHKVGEPRRVAGISRIVLGADRQRAAEMLQSLLAAPKSFVLVVSSSSKASLSFQKAWRHARSTVPPGPSREAAEEGETSRFRPLSRVRGHFELPLSIMFNPLQTLFFPWQTSTTGIFFRSHPGEPSSFDFYLFHQEGHY